MSLWTSLGPRDYSICMRWPLITVIYQYSTWRVNGDRQTERQIGVEIQEVFWHWRYLITFNWYYDKPTGIYKILNKKISSGRRPNLRIYETIWLRPLNYESYNMFLANLTGGPKNLYPNAWYTTLTGNQYESFRCQLLPADRRRPWMSRDVPSCSQEVFPHKLKTMCSLQWDWFSIIEAKITALHDFFIKI